MTFERWHDQVSKRRKQEAQQELSEIAERVDIVSVK